MIGWLDYALWTGIAAAAGGFLVAAAYMLAVERAERDLRSRRL